MVYIIVKSKYICGDVSDPCDFVGSDIIAVFRNDWKTVLFLRQYLNNDNVKVSDLPEEGKCKDFYPLSVCNAYSDL